MASNQFNFEGLTAEQVLASRKKQGSNKLNYQKENSFFQALKRIVKDPMILLLIIAASIYFISGKIGDGIFLSVAIILQTSISFFQFTYLLTTKWKTLVSLSERRFSRYMPLARPLFICINSFRLPLIAIAFA